MKYHNTNSAGKKILCLGKGTKVLMADLTYKEIETVQVGDIVASFNVRTSVIHESRVGRTASSEHASISRLTLEGGIRLECTSDHPVWIHGKGWCATDPKEAMENYGEIVLPLLTGDACLAQENGALIRLHITAIDTLVGWFEMYVIDGGNEHCFFANNILVHDENVALLQEGLSRGEFRSAAP
jgi:Ataxin-1 and HBP1 module (AXH).